MARLSVRAYTATPLLVASNVYRVSVQTPSACSLSPTHSTSLLRPQRRAYSLRSTGALAPIRSRTRLYDQARPVTVQESAHTLQRRKYATTARRMSPSRTSPPSSTSSPSSTASAPVPLFIASLGNPHNQYATTRHNAGHTLLLALAQHLSLPAPSKHPSYPHGLITLHPGAHNAPHPSTTAPIALFMPTKYMNELGPSIAKGYHTFSQQTHQADPPAAEVHSKREKARLVILHDDLALPLAAYKVKTSTAASARGHNGLRSVLAQSSLARLPMTRISIGIGPRPESRESEDVARFVLGRMSEGDIQRVSGLAGSVWGDIEGLK